MKRFLLFINTVILCLLILTGTPYAAYKNLTTWSETDANSDITVTSTSISLDGSDTTGRVYKRIEGQGLNGLRWRLKTNVVSADSNVAIFGISTDTDVSFTDWTDGFAVYWNGTVLTLWNIAEDTTDTSATLSASTDYYLEIRRVENQLRVLIYTDEYSTLSDTLLLNDFGDDFYCSDVTLMSIAEFDGPCTFREDFDDLNDWSTSTTGTCSASQQTFDSQETLYQTATGNGTASNYTDVNQDIGTFPNEFTLVWKDYYDALTATGTAPYIYAYGATARFGMGVYSGKIWVAGHGDITCTTAEDTWYEWKAVINQTSGTAIISRRTIGGTWTSIGTATSLGAAGTNGTIKFQVNGHSVTGTATVYTDYVRYFPEAIDDGGDVEVTVSNVSSYDINFHLFSNPATALTGDMEESFANLTSWTTGGTGDCDIVSGELHVTGDGNCYQTLAGASAGSAWVATVIHRINTVASGDAAHLIAVFSTSSYAQAMVVEDGGYYYWALAQYTGVSQSVQVTDVRAELDTDYTVQLIQRNASTGGVATSRYVGLYIDGVAVALSTAAMDFTVTQIKFGMIDETNYTANATWYGDDLHVLADQVLYTPSVCRASNGNIVVVARLGDHHNGDAAHTFEAFESSDEGETWSHLQSVDYCSDTTKSPANANLFVMGDDIYLFANSNDYYCYVYKASVSGGTLGTFSLVSGASTSVIAYSHFVDPSDSDVIILTGYVWTSGNHYVLSYDTSTDTFLSSGSWVTLDTDSDYSGMRPNESTMIVNPQDSNETICMVRRDKVIGYPDWSSDDTQYITYRKCTGDVLTSGNWGSSNSLSSYWSNGHGGKPWLASIGDQLVLCGYMRRDTQFSWCNFMVQFDPGDMETLTNGKIYNNTALEKHIEPGNGQIINPASGEKYHPYVTASGSTGFYLVDLGIYATLTVNIDADRGSGQWRFVGESTWLSEGERTDIPAGDYTIEFNDVAGLRTPDDISVTLACGDDATKTGTYTSASVPLVLLH